MPKPLTSTELLKMLAQALAQETGAVVTPKRVKGASINAVGSVDWTKVKHTCPKCSHTGPVDPDFGVKLVRGIARSQSWCKNCRATTNYYGKARKYRRHE